MIKRICWTLVLLGAIASAWVASLRWEIERANRTVDLTVEWTELRSLSAVLRVPIQEMLQRFRLAGVSSVALQEETVHQLVDDGQIFKPDPFTDPRVRDLIGGTGRSDERTLLAFPDSLLRNRVEQNLTVRWGADRVHRSTLGSMPALIVDGAYAQFRDLGAGLDPAAQAAVLRAGLGIVGRLKNYAGLSAGPLLWTIQDLRASGAHTLICFGDEVLGNPDLIHESAADLQAAGLAYGDVEFGKQHGDEKLARALGGSIVRVHTIQGAELANLTPDAAIDRFVKAVRERNIRLCYIHVMSSVTGTTLEADESFVTRIARGLRSAGFHPGPARPMHGWSAPPSLLLLIVLGVAGAGLLLAVEILGFAPTWVVVLTGAGWVVLSALVLRIPLIGVQGAALLATILLPTLALVHARLPMPEQEAPRLDRRTAARHALAWTILASLISLIGALYVIGLLGSTLFMSMTEQFLGIKPSIVAPVILVALVYWGRLLDPVPIADRRDRFADRIRALMAEPIVFWHAVAAIAVVGILLLLVARSGNDSGLEVSTLELKTRKVLDGWLIARPRTKEFLLGNPALFLAFYAAARRWRYWVLPLLILGAIGQTSLVNTFCHIHTPLLISIFHAINGMWLGLLIGWLLSLLLERFSQNRQAVEAESAGRRPGIEAIR